MDDVKPCDSSRSSAAPTPEEEWDKFRSVEGLIATVNQYMNIYSDLLESGKLIVIGSHGTKEPRHKIPRGMSKQHWKFLSPADQLEKVQEVAQETLGPMKSLLEEVAQQFGVEAFAAPLKGQDRIKEKRDEEYKGNILRVIDFVRCSAVIVLDDLVDARNIVAAFEEPDGRFCEHWKLVRVKDGFAKADNFLVGGYRDIKLNVRKRSNGHVIEIQLHLRPYLELKEHGGHKHYEFSRTLNISGVTSATQLFNADDLEDIARVGERALRENEEDVEERIRILRQLGDLYSALWWHGTHAILRYEEARNLCETHFGDNPNVLTCEVLMGLANCVSEIQRHWDNEEKLNMRTKSNKWRTVDNRPWIERCIDMSRGILGARHPFTMKAMRIKADIWNEHDEVAEAEEMYEKVLQAQIEVLGREHPDVAETMNNFGDFLQERNEDDDAEVSRGISLYLEALEAVLPKLGRHSLCDMLYSNATCSLEDYGESHFSELKQRLDSIAQRYAFELGLAVDDESDEEYSDDESSD